MDSILFEAWFVECLLPDLPADSVIVMDNASFHRKCRLQAIAQSKGHSVIFLPPYSPELNPIENFWAWLKSKLRKSLHNFACLDDAICYCFNVVYRRQKGSSNKQIFYNNHESELIRFEAAKKKLDNLLPDRKFHTQEWRQEYTQLQTERDAVYTELKAVREKAKHVDGIRKQVYSVRRPPARNKNTERMEAML